MIGHDLLSVVQLQFDKIFVPILGIMLHIPKIGDYLKILTADEVKNVVAIIFITTPDELEKYV